VERFLKFRNGMSAQIALPERYMMLLKGCLADMVSQLKLN
jgi:hypothetical protein